MAFTAFEFSWTAVIMFCVLHSKQNKKIKKIISNLARRKEPFTSLLDLSHLSIWLRVQGRTKLARWLDKPSASCVKPSCPIFSFLLIWNCHAASAIECILFVPVSRRPMFTCHRWLPSHHFLLWSLRQGEPGVSVIVRKWGLTENTQREVRKMDEQWHFTIEFGRVQLPCEVKLKQNLISL